MSKGVDKNDIMNFLLLEIEDLKKNVIGRKRPGENRFRVWYDRETYFLCRFDCDIFYENIHIR